MNPYKKNISLHAIVLLGCIIPLGNIWGPLLIKTDDSDLKNHKKFIIRFQVLLTVVFFVLGVAVWLKQIQGLASGSALETSGMKIWIGLGTLFFFIYPIVNIIIILLKKSPKLLCYPKIGR